jgi:hypothetical protein
MKKLKMTVGKMTFEDGGNKYLGNCRQRNLREGTIKHYKQSYTRFYKYINPNTLIEDINESIYRNYVLHLKSTLDNDVVYVNITKNRKQLLLSLDHNVSLVFLPFYQKNTRPAE